MKCEKYYEQVEGKCKKTNYGKVQEIVDEFQYKKIGRFLVDVQTANAILQVHKALKPENKEKFKRIINSDIKRAGLIAHKLAF